MQIQSYLYAGEPTKSGLNSTTENGPNGPANPDTAPESEVAQFLFEHLEAYGDPLEDIRACLAYVRERGGGVFVAREAKEREASEKGAKEEGELLGACVVAATGMRGFIPENILVYIAVSGKARGKGVGSALIEAVKEGARGSVALHVEPDNPARRLYERHGFTHKYIEMRLHR